MSGLSPEQKAAIRQTKKELFEQYASDAVSDLKTEWSIPRELQTFLPTFLNKNTQLLVSKGNDILIGRVEEEVEITPEALGQITIDNLPTYAEYKEYMLQVRQNLSHDPFSPEANFTLSEDRQHALDEIVSRNQEKINTALQSELGGYKTELSEEDFTDLQKSSHSWLYDLGFGQNLLEKTKEHVAKEITKNRADTPDKIQDLYESMAPRVDVYTSKFVSQYVQPLVGNDSSKEIDEFRLSTKYQELIQARVLSAFHAFVNENRLTTFLSDLSDVPVNVEATVNSRLYIDDYIEEVQDYAPKAKIDSMLQDLPFWFNTNMPDEFIEQEVEDEVFNSFLLEDLKTRLVQNLTRNPNIAEADWTRIVEDHVSEMRLVELVGYATTGNEFAFVETFAPDEV